MGEIAEMMLDGTLCEGCGEYLGENAGFPIRCVNCERQIQVTSEKVQCPFCKKRVKQTGLADHTRAVHGEKNE